MIGQLRWQDLEGDNAIETRVSGAIHLAHAAGPEWAEDFVRAETHARRNGHRK
jgi:hypothetical protein